MSNSNLGRKERNDRAATSYSTDSYVNSFQNLPGRPHADKAIPLLQKIASLVKPIMRSHGWRLPLLSEFFPDNPALVGLNVNGGQQILLRLRPHWAPNTFYSEEEIVGVMLHELTHNVHGPHDDRFYKYLAGLEREYEDLQRSGYAGEGFFAPGERLGLGTSHNLSMTEAKKRALEAAERRAKRAGGGANRLGGAGWTTKTLMKTPGQLAAEAAERRMRDNKACAHDAEAEAEAAKAAQEGARHDAADLPHVSHDDVIVIESDSSDSDIELVSGPSAKPSGSGSGPAPPAAKNQGPSTSKAAKSASASSAAPAPSTSRPRPTSSQAPPPPVPHHTQPAAQPPTSTSQHPAAPPPAAEEEELEFVEWPCDACTYVNHPQRTLCEICATPKPGTERRREPSPPPAPVPAPQTSFQPPFAFPQRNNERMIISRSEDPDAWDCATCGERGMPGNFWSCRFCGAVKGSS
ncbi:WLM-domain-containing protein [Clavulina sp. PMI_390]|nr:WLM-domain-containing protein [Clavulina sp. PMI_390]